MHPLIIPEASAPVQAENWAILEIMGHERLAGKISEATLAGTQMVRVEVPATDKLPAFERLLSGASIFSMTPVPESVARVVAGNLQKTAVSGIAAYGYSLAQKQEMSQTLGLPAPTPPPVPAEWGNDDDEAGDEHGPDYERPY